MSDDHHDDEESGRVTSPMQDYDMGQVGTGVAVMLVGVAVAYVLPSVLGFL
jgi:hypothetical protein